MSKRWIVAQIGSRQHYAVARAMAQRQRLERLYTDIWLSRGRSLLSNLGSDSRALAGRYHADIPASLVTSFSAGAILRQMRTRHHHTGPAAYHRFLNTGRWFGKKVASALRKSPPDPARHAAFLFCTGALEPIEFLSGRGVATLLDQIDVARVEENIIREEAARWPGWEASEQRVPEVYYERLEQEWAAADGIVVNSNWTREGLIQQGVAAAKIHVIPLAYEPEPTPAIERAPLHGRPLRVLWLGQINLRKGLPYLFEAARLLLDEPVQFDLVGQINVTPIALQAAPANVRVSGPVSRSAVHALYQQADVFVLPTLSDGFAITQLEAMWHGLPVIATPRCGDVVTNGVNGFIVPPADGRALADAIGQLANDPSRLVAMSAAARERAKAFSLDRFADGIDQAVLNLAGK